MASGRAEVSPLRAALLQDPIAFLSAEHARQTVLLAHLERVVRAPRARGARELARALLDWLSFDLPLHIADEECSLYPRLRGRDAEGVLDRLSAEHHRDREMVHTIIQGLRSVAAGTALSPGFAEMARAFVEAHRAHLALEEAVIAPLARRALSHASQAALAEDMARRRGC